MSLFNVHPKETYMVRVTEEFQCSSCEDNLFYRVRRRWWMRLMPGSRCYKCASCHREVFVRQPSKHHPVRKISWRVSLF